RKTGRHRRSVAGFAALRAVLLVAFLIVRPGGRRRRRRLPAEFVRHGRAGEALEVGLPPRRASAYACRAARGAVHDGRQPFTRLRHGEVDDILVRVEEARLGQTPAHLEEHAPYRGRGGVVDEVVVVFVEAHGDLGRGEACVELVPHRPG